MVIEKNILDKYKVKENQTQDVKAKITEIINNLTGLQILNQNIDIKDKTVTLQISSVIKSIVLEKKLEIEKDLVRAGSTVVYIQ